MYCFLFCSLLLGSLVIHCLCRPLFPIFCWYIVIVASGFLAALAAALVILHTLHVPTSSVDVTSHIATRRRSRHLEGAMPPIYHSPYGHRRRYYPSLLQLHAAARPCLFMCSETMVGAPCRHFQFSDAVHRHVRTDVARSGERKNAGEKTTPHLLSLPL